jgi:hypothetical protein
MSWCAWQLPRGFIARISDAEHVRKLRDDLYEALQDNHSVGQWPGPTTIARWKPRSIIKVAAPAETRTPNLHRAKKSLTEECGWKGGGVGSGKGRMERDDLAQSAEAISQRAIRVSGCRFTKVIG